MYDYTDVNELAEFAGLETDIFPEWGLTVVGYMDSDGNNRFETKLFGANVASNIVGVLHLVQHELIMMATDDDEYEDIDEE